MDNGGAVRAGGDCDPDRGRRAGRREQDCPRRPTPSEWPQPPTPTLASACVLNGSMLRWWSMYSWRPLVICAS